LQNSGKVVAFSPRRQLIYLYSTTGCAGEIGSSP